jgi:hypothetical protein
VCVEVAPVIVEKLRIAVTDLPVGGLLRMDFLISADTFIGMRDGELIMKFEGREVRYSLRPEELSLNYIARTEKRKLPEMIEITKAPPRKRGFEVKYESIAYLIYRGERFWLDPEWLYERMMEIDP